MLLRLCNTDVLSAIVFNSVAVKAATEVLERFVNAVVDRLAICAEDNDATCAVVRLLRTTDVAAAKAVVEILVT